MSDIDILLVEDNPGDVRLIEQEFEAREISATLHAVQTGDEALGLLYQRDESAEVSRPRLVLLDLNLPVMGGLTVLETIKSHPQLKRLPVIILTGSKSELELNEAYEAHANACLIKPVDPDEWGTLVQSLADFWISTVALPPAPESADNPPQ